MTKKKNVLFALHPLGQRESPLTYQQSFVRQHKNEAFCHFFPPLGAYAGTSGEMSGKTYFLLM